MKNKTTAILLCFFLGGLGVHKFYLGRTGAGLLYLLFFWTFIPSLLALIDFFVLIFMGDVEFNIRYNPFNPLAGPQIQNVVVQMPAAPYPGYYPPPQGAYAAQPYPQPYAQYPTAGQAGYPPQAAYAPQAQLAAAPAQPAQLTPAAATRDVAEQLRDLNNLRVSGAITEQEFEAQKRRIMGG